LGWLIVTHRWDQILDPSLADLQKKLEGSILNFAFLLAFGLHVFLSPMRIYVSLWILDYSEEFKCLITREAPRYVRTFDFLARLFVGLTPFLVFVSLYLLQPPHTALIAAFVVSTAWDIFMFVALNHMLKSSEYQRHVIFFREYIGPFKRRLKVWLVNDVIFVIFLSIEAGLLKYVDDGKLNLADKYSHEAVAVISVFALLYVLIAGLELYVLFWKNNKATSDT
jgi:hypothetical protein